MFTQLAQQFNFILTQFVVNFYFTISIIGVLLIIQLINQGCKYRLNHLGILPRTSSGLFGIVFSPFLHGSFSHFFLNAIPLYLLLNMVLIYGGQSGLWHITWIGVVLGGGLVWLFGRKVLHVGASGIILSYWGYLLMSAYQHFSVLSVMLAVICLYYFGYFFTSIFPGDKRVSWEAHLFGLLAGIVAALF